MSGRIRRHWKGLLASAIALIVILVVGIPFVYINFIEGDAPPPLSLSDVAATTSPAAADSSGASDPSEPAESTSSSAAVSGAATHSPSAEHSSPATAAATSSSDAATADGIAGTWTIGSGSQAGYRVHETLAGQSTTAVGRTDAVSGSLTATDTAVTAADITVQVDQIASDNGQRDRQFTGRIMNTNQFPTANFALMQPISFKSTLVAGANITASATGKLTLHGTTKDVTFPITVQRTGAGLAATGTIDITYQDYGINNPSIGGFVSVGESGTIEFLIKATRD